MIADTAAWYAWFAANEAAGSSPTYERLANRVAADDATITRLSSLPPSKRQPNLLFASARHLGIAVDDPSRFLAEVSSRWDELAATMMVRSTQTNEAARCGVLLPTLAAIEGPVSLIEVGASAGLCLLPDRYRYEYRRAGGRTLEPDTASDAQAPCIEVDVPADFDPKLDLPEIRFRVGLDLNPLDVTNDDDVGWLRSCIWPEHVERCRRLDAAVAVARQDPPTVVDGDLLADLDQLISSAPADTTVVVFHSAVLAYVDGSERAAFVDRMADTGTTWISNEGPGVTPRVSTAATPPPFARSPAHFVVALDGTPVALSDPHGRWLAPISPG